ncbi:metallophosphoesterase family protein [Actinomycetota bacterium]
MKNKSLKNIVVNLNCLVLIILLTFLIFFSGCINFPNNIERTSDPLEDITQDSVSSNIETIETEINNDQSEAIESPTEEKIQESDDSRSEENEDEILFSFTVTGDSRPADDYLPQPETFLKLLQLIKEEGSSFNISVGDIINGGTADEEVIKRQFNDYLNAVGGSYSVNFVSPGNHDLTNEPTRKYFREMILMRVINKATDADIKIYNPGTSEGLDSFFYYFEFNNIYFIILNAFEKGYWGAVKTDQLAWLEDVLEVLKDKVVFVTIHTPPYSVLNPDTITDGSKHVAFSGKENLEYIRELFRNYKVDGVFSGHEHVYNKEFHNGTTYSIIALSGEYPFFPEEEGGFYHYVRVDVKSDSWVFNVIGINGDLRYKEEIDFNY